MQRGQCRTCNWKKKKNSNQKKTNENWFNRKFAAWSNYHIFNDSYQENISVFSSRFFVSSVFIVLFGVYFFFQFFGVRFSLTRFLHFWFFMMATQPFPFSLFHLVIDSTTDGSFTWNDYNWKFLTKFSSSSYFEEEKYSNLMYNQNATGRFVTIFAIWSWVHLIS